MMGVRSHRYIRCNEIVTRKTRHGGVVGSLVNIVTPFCRYRYVGYTRPRARERKRGQAPIIPLNPCNDVNEQIYTNAFVWFSRYNSSVTSVTRTHLVNIWGGFGW